jgi:hypothetical protein
VTSLNTRSTSLELLSQARAHVHSLQRQPGLKQSALGLPRYDWQLWRLGRERLDRLGNSSAGNTSQRLKRGPDTFLASQLYQDGGHTALIGDFVTALTGTGEYPHLVLTNIYGNHDEPLADRIRLRTGILPENVHILPGPSLEERLDQLTATLLDMQPRRLFLFQHPDDPLASVVAQPAISRQCFLVHHADATPTLGLHLPGVRVIELNPFAAANARIRRIPVDLLLLTAPDPGPRPCDFLSRGHLVTATCGSAHKYESDYVYSYADAVAVILQTTGGWHIHIGPLSADALARIFAALPAQVDAERFIHLPWVASLAEALWQHGCDVYFASFPIDGARAYVEVAASATPYLAHRGQRSRAIDSWAIGPESAVWSTMDELANTLQRMTDRGALEECARGIRRCYDQYHHPKVFRQTLHSIVAGEGGLVDPDEPARNQLAIRSLVGAIENLLTDREEIIDQRLDRIAADAQTERLDGKVAAEQLESTVQSLVVSLEHNITTSETLKRSVEQEKLTTQSLTTTSEELKRHVEQEALTVQSLITASEELKRHIEQETLAVQSQSTTTEELKRHVEQEALTVQSLITASEVLKRHIEQETLAVQSQSTTTEELKRRIEQETLAVQSLITTTEELQRRIEQLEARRHILRQVGKKVINILRRYRNWAQ